MGFNGHKNWNHWNVSLWLFNNEIRYEQLRSCVAMTDTMDQAASLLLSRLPPHTPDGAPYTVTSIRAALVGFAG